METSSHNRSKGPYDFHCFIEDNEIIDNKDLLPSSAFLGADCLFFGHENLSYFVNRDSTGFYVFSMAGGLNPIAKWVRARRDTDPNSSAFQASYTAAITYAGDRLNGYR